MISFALAIADKRQSQFARFGRETSLSVGGAEQPATKSLAAFNRGSSALSGLHIR